MTKRKGDDGFYHLVPRTKKAEPKTKKKKEPKFKKGGWKYWLNKRLKEWRQSCEDVKDFHFEKRENILIACKKDPEVMFFNKRIGKSTMKELKKLVGKDDVFVLIDAYDKTYLSFSLKSYLKLMEVDKMIINFHLEADNDGIEIVDVYENEAIITNINDLANFINFHRQGIAGVYDIQANCTCYTAYNFKFRIVVRKVDGSVETYKGDMNDFMKAYDIWPF